MNTAKMHLGLGVRALEPAVDFYRALLGVAPDKLHPTYARFDTPQVVLSLNAHPEAAAAPLPTHFGLRVEDRAEVGQAATRLRGAGLDVLVEGETDCCYALQDKVWVSDPDGHQWEIYALLAHTDGAETRTASGSAGGGTGACCPGGAPCCPS